MKKLLICLCLLSSPVFANQADTAKLNSLIYNALVAKDYDKARWLATTAQQKEYVETEIQRAKDAKAKAKATIGANQGFNPARCYAGASGIVVCN